MKHEAQSALVEQARSGCPRALNRLLATCYPGLLARARAMLGHPEDARDAAQEAAMLVFQRIHQLEDAEAFPGWSGMILRRSCLRQLDRRHRQHELLDDVQCARAISQSATSEDRVYLSEVIRHLERPMMEIVELRLLLGLSVRETAARLDISEGAVKARLHRVRRKALAFTRRDRADSARRVNGGNRAVKA